MPDDVLTRAGPVAVPMDYELPVGTEIFPKVVTAQLDGTSAGGAFLAVLEVISPNGTVTAYCLRQESIAAGASAAVSWFPGGGVDDSSAAADVDTAGVTAIASPAGTLTVTSPSGPTADIDMPTTGVSAGTYGDATHVSEVTVDAEGRVTAASSVPISGAGGAGGLIVLYDSGYLGVAAASIDTGAGGIAAGHFCLFVVCYLRVDTAVTSDNVLATFNNDSSALYDAVRIQTNASAVSDGGSALATSALLGNCPGATAAAHIFGALELTMPAYDGTNNYKAGVAESGSAQDVAANANNSAIGVAYQSLSAISRMKIVPGTAGKNFLAGSRMVVYGLQ